VTEQLPLLPAPPARLTGYQQQALDLIRATVGGLTDEQLGDAIHQRRRCDCAARQCVDRGYTARDGRQMGGTLRDKGLLVKRGRSHWQALDGQTQPAPDGLGEEIPF
jgi:hypothetical protein